MIARLRRYAIENELLYLFLHNRIAQLAALIALIMIGGAVLAARPTGVSAAAACCRSLESSGTVEHSPASISTSNPATRLTLLC